MIQEGLLEHTGQEPWLPGWSFAHLCGPHRSSTRARSLALGTPRAFSSDRFLASSLIALQKLLSGFGSSPTDAKNSWPGMGSGRVGHVNVHWTGRPSVVHTMIEQGGRC